MSLFWNLQIKVHLLVTHLANKTWLNPFKFRETCERAGNFRVLQAILRGVWNETIFLKAERARYMTSSPFRFGNEDRKTVRIECESFATFDCKKSCLLQVNRLLPCSKKLPVHVLSLFTTSSGFLWFGRDVLGRRSLLWSLDHLVSISYF